MNSHVRRRTTIMNCALAFATMFAVACVAENPSDPSDDPELVGIQILPGTATVAPNETQQFTAQGITGDGATVATTVAWDATGGTIDGDGMFLAPADAGTYEIIAVHTVRTWLSDTAEATVEGIEPPVPVASVEVTPSTASIDVDGTVQLSATVRDAAGNVLERAVSWSTSNEAIAGVSLTGLVTGVGSGTATIVATSEGQSGSASVTVTTASAVPDVLYADGFESGNLGGWHDVFTSQGGDYSVIRDDTLAYEGTHVLRVFYPRDGPGAGAATVFVEPGEHIYARIRMRFPTDWQGSTKLMMVRASQTQWGSFGRGAQCPDGSDFVLANVTTGGQGNPGSPRFYTYYVDMAHQPNNPSMCFGNSGIPGADPPPGPTPTATYFDLRHDLQLETWQTIELEAHLNTVGSSDGWQRLWVDGTLVAEWVDMRLRTDERVLWQGFTLENSAFSQSIDRVLYVDDVVVMTGRP